MNIKKCFYIITIIMSLLLLTSCSSSISSSSKHLKNNNIHSKNISDRQEITLHTINLIGTPYKYGGSTKDGFDCSGMVQYIYINTLGIKLPRTAKNMATSKIGKDIAKNKLEVGDLVFFNTNGHKYSHVGIYIGNNQFVHAPNRKKRIKIDSLNSKYYSKRFTKAKTFF